MVRRRSTIAPRAAQRNWEPSRGSRPASTLFLAAQIPVNLRVVVDRENLPNLAGPGQIGGGTRMARPIRVGFQDADRTQLRTLRLRPAGRAANNYSTAWNCGRHTWPWPRRIPTCDDFTSHACTACTTWLRLANGRRPPSIAARLPRRNGPLRLTAASTAARPRGPSGKRLGSYAPKSRTGRRRHRPLGAIETCSYPGLQSCPVASVCGGGCGAVAVNRTGTVQRRTAGQFGNCWGWRPLLSPGRRLIRFSGYIRPPAPIR